MTAARTPRPVSGRWFEELTVGDVVQHATRRTVTETDNVLFTTMTMNPAPLRLDAQYATTTEFGQSRPDAGLVEFEHRAYNQRGQLVCSARRTGLMHRRPDTYGRPGEAS